MYMSIQRQPVILSRPTFPFFLNITLVYLKPLASLPKAIMVFLKKRGEFLHLNRYGQLKRRWMCIYLGVDILWVLKHQLSSGGDLAPQGMFDNL